MTLVINTNITSSVAQSNLSKVGDSLQTTIQRLSSGLRVNNAADDASGFAIANRMDAQVRGMAVATRNANDAISFSQTASGALSQISNNLQRMRELAVQAANGSNSSSDTSLLNQEFSQLQTEVARIQSSTTFNGLSVFNSTDTVFQIGANNTSNDTVNLQGTALSNTKSLGTLTLTDRNNSSALTDLTNALTNASACASASIATGLHDQISYVANTMIDAINSSQKISFAAENELVSNFASATSSAQATGITLTNFVSKLQSALSGTTTITYGPQVTFPQLFGSSTAMTSTNIAQVGAFGTATGATLESVLTNSKNYVSTYAYNGSDATAINNAITTAYNTAKAGNMKVSNFANRLQTAISLLTQSSTTSQEFGFQASTRATTVTALAATQTSSTGQSNSLSAITAIDSALTEVNTASAVQGALQNRFSAIISNLSAFSQSQTAAKSRIVDADFATETAKLSKNQILQQTGTAMLAQANQIPSTVLSLLK